jgi:regulator of sirC expression with transglutaminase-like and TPR domain
LLDFQADFAEDGEFLKLLCRRDEEVNLARGALELARDAEQGLDFAATLEWIEARSRELSGPLARAATDEETLLALAECLSGRHGLAGNAECFDDPESSFLNRVIERKTGLPISLSVLYMAVAEGAGVTLRGVGAPVRFLTRYETLDAPLFVDAFAAGVVLSVEQCLERVRETSGLTGDVARAALEPVGPRAIIMRMLNNLKSLYARQENWRACWKVQHRLLALQPAVFHERRDWALISLRSGRTGRAIDMLENCLPTCPEDERELLERQLGEAKNQLAQWN